MRHTVNRSILPFWLVFVTGWSACLAGGTDDATMTPAQSGRPAINARPVRQLRLDVKLEPIEGTKQGGNVELLLSIKSDSAIYELEGAIQDKSNLVIDFPLRWVDTLTGQKEHSYRFSVSVPKGEWTGLLVQMLQKIPFRSSISQIRFDYTGDTLIVYDAMAWLERQFAAAQTPTVSQSDDPIRDTMTNEQLQTEYEVVLDLSDPAHMKTVERILGPIPDSCLYDRSRMYYKLTITLEKLIEVTDQGVDGEYVTPPPWGKKHPAPEKKTRPETDTGKDSVGKQGALDKTESEIYLIGGLSLEFAGAATLVPRFGGHRQGIVS